MPWQKTRNINTVLKKTLCLYKGSGLVHMACCFFAFIYIKMQIKWRSSPDIKGLSYRLSE